MKAVIIEDESLIAKELQHKIMEVAPEIRIIEVLPSLKTANKWFMENAEPDLLFADIQLSDGTSFEIFDRFDLKCPVIFTTAYDKYAIKAIRFSALDYLLKPVDILELQNAVNRHIVKLNSNNHSGQKELVGNLIQNLRQKDPQEFKLAISVKEGVFLFDPKEIICLEGQNNYTKFFLTNQKPLLVAKTLKEYDDILSDHNFVRVHKSFLVNKEHVKRMDNEGQIWLTNNVNVPVSRRKKAEIMEMFS